MPQEGLKEPAVPEKISAMGNADPAVSSASVTSRSALHEQFISPSRGPGVLSKDCHAEKPGWVDQACVQLAVRLGLSERRCRYDQEIVADPGSTICKIGPLLIRHLWDLHNRGTIATWVELEAALNGALDEICSAMDEGRSLNRNDTCLTEKAFDSFELSWIKV